MPIRFVCLANSYKLHGRCVAGIVLSENNKPILQRGSPKWIRPISSTEHGEIPTELVAHLELLDIVEIDEVIHVQHGHQSENATFDERSIKLVGTFPIEEISPLCEDQRPLIFGNRRKAVAQDAIHLLHHSLMLIRVDDFVVEEVPSPKSPGKTQYRLGFQYKKNTYDFPITDPVFLEDYKEDGECIEGAKELFLTLSIGLNFDNFYFKLVAGILY
jgi:hypothetical protein